MPSPSKIALLPEEVRSELDDRLVESAFGDVQGQSDWLKAQGHDISKSSVHRYSSVLEKQIASVKASAQAAILFAKAVGDDVSAMDAGTLGVIQTSIFETMVGALEALDEDDPIKRMKFLESAARASANVARASVDQKKWAQEMRARTEAAAAAVEKITRKGGLSAEAANEIRREILGIAA